MTSRDCNVNGHDSRYRRGKRGGWKRGGGGGQRADGTRCASVIDVDICMPMKKRKMLG